MALFGRPSEKLIKEYRDAVQVHLPQEAFPIGLEHVKLFRAKPDLIRFSTSAHCIDYSVLSLAAKTDRPDFRIVCVRQQADPILQQSDVCIAALSLPLVEVRKTALLQAKDVPVRSDAQVEPLAGPLKFVKLISASDLEVHQVELQSIKVIIHRFSFPGAQSHPAPLLSRPLPRPQTATPRLQAVTPPMPPPALKNADLPERLRSILTPPIHEILSDPQLALPETPFPYQTYGIKWLYDRDSALLADEMGLGKTMQAIIAARLLWRDGQVKQILVVCPKALTSNWKKELEHWWPGVEWYTKVAEGNRRRFLRLGGNNVTVKIINYESLQRELDWLKRQNVYHDLVIIDEAQRIKNPKSETSQAVKALQATRRWALTGTPLENSTRDLVSILAFVRPGLITEADSPESMRDAIRPFMLRRRQEEVLPDLPARIEQDIEIELGARQRAAYDRAEREGVIELNDKGDSVTVTHVFALINKLRQICGFDSTSGESAKAEFLLKELEEIVESGRKALIFGQFIDDRFGLKRLAMIIREANKFPLSGGPLELYGDTPIQQRNVVVELFQNSSRHQILLLSFGVGGVGLNLQAASYVLLFDRWWNPAVEDQAIKRCHRIGQGCSVLAQRLYCKDTIEERMLLKTLEKKRKLFNHVIDENRPAAALGLTEEEIFSLFNLTVRPRRSSQRAAPATPARIVLENVDSKEFENLVALIYEKEGYDVRVTGRSHDGGIDIEAKRVSAVGEDRIVVQCKHQKQNVGRPVLQQLWGVLNSDPSVTRCDLVTSAGFTSEALEFALGKRLTLVDRRKLVELAQRHGVAEFVCL